MGQIHIQQILDTEKHSIFLKLEVDIDFPHCVSIYVKGSVFAKFWRVQASLLCSVTFSPCYISLVEDMANNSPGVFVAFRCGNIGPLLFFLLFFSYSFFSIWHIMLALLEDMNDHMIYSYDLGQYHRGYSMAQTANAAGSANGYIY